MTAIDWPNWISAVSNLGLLVIAGWIGWVYQRKESNRSAAQEQRRRWLVAGDTINYLNRMIVNCEALLIHGFSERYVERLAPQGTRWQERSDLLLLEEKFIKRIISFEGAVGACWVISSMIDDNDLKEIARKTVVELISKAGDIAADLAIEYDIQYKTTVVIKFDEFGKLIHNRSSRS